MPLVCSSQRHRQQVCDLSGSSEKSTQSSRILIHSKKRSVFSCSRSVTDLTEGERLRGAHVLWLPTRCPCPLGWQPCQCPPPWKATSPWQSESFRLVPSSPATPLSSLEMPNHLTILSEQFRSIKYTHIVVLPPPSVSGVPFILQSETVTIKRQLPIPPAPPPPLHLPPKHHSPPFCPYECDYSRSLR